MTRPTAHRRPAYPVRQDGVTIEVQVQSPERPRAHRVKVGVAVLLCLLITGLLIWQRHRLAGLPHVLANANWGWVGLAICAQVASVGSLASEQRRLINVRGDRRPLPFVLASTWAGNAISVSLPLIGSAAAAVFVFTRFTTIGVDRAAAAWTLAISGVYSTVSFAAITAVGAITSSSPALAVTGVATIAVVIIPVCVGLGGLRRPRVHLVATTAIAAALLWSQRMFRRPQGDPDQISSRAVDQLSSLRLGWKSALLAGCLAVVNWMFDLACLVCVIHAVHAAVPWHGIILAWAAGSGASSLGLTPGGLGVVEIALGSALIGIGLPAGAAIAAALLYRATKLGLVLAVGGMTLLFIRHGDAGHVHPAEID